MQDPSRQNKQGRTARSTLDQNLGVAMQLDLDEENNNNSNNSTKRPPNAYMLFCNDTREKLLQREPNLNYKTVMTRLGELWNALSKEEKQPYIEKAKQSQAEFKANNPDYKYKPRKPKAAHQATNQLILPNGISNAEASYLMLLGAQTLLNQKQGQNIGPNNILSQIQPSAAAAPTTSHAAAVAAAVAGVTPGLATSNRKNQNANNSIQNNQNGMPGISSPGVINMQSTTGMNTQTVNMGGAGTNVGMNNSNIGLNGTNGSKVDDLGLFQGPNELPFHLNSLCHLENKMAPVNALNAAIQLQASVPPNQGINPIQSPQSNYQWTGQHNK
ncbi:hypothetical protein M9Y10_009551 [Tritrichomonas musculus]|uniref:HMG box domain-containing protein n=1 Tax=Tritrichomonas musculus TaxID=1915356 RepID=A0ABR2INW8_9EUKA